MHSTTQPEVRIQRGFGQQLQLMCCTNLLSCICIFLTVSQSLEFNLELSVALIERSIEIKIKVEYFQKFRNQSSEFRVQSDQGLSRQ